MSAAAMSNDLYRGISLTAGQPAAAIDLSADDAASGAYAGAELLAAAPAQSGGPRLGNIEYLGFTLPTRGATIIDVGVIHLRAPGAPPGVYSAYAGDDVEPYLGLRRGAVGGYLYLAPDYFGEGRTAAYAELDAATHVAADLRLFGHIGLRVMGAGGAAPSMTWSPDRSGAGPYGGSFGAGGARYDAATGVEWAIGRARVSVTFALEGATPGARSAPPATSSLEAKATWSF
ncbi:MAG: TorF family putative porin [Caulobacteraceae bacterium]